MGNPLAIRFIVKKPSTSYIKNIFFITFNDNVWIAGLIIMIISALAVKIILSWEVKEKTVCIKKVKQNSYSLSDVTLIALEAVCQQGTTTEPQSLSGRILALILFGAFMFIYVSYSANIVVLLQSTTKINDIRELLESRIEVGGCQTHYMRNYFEVIGQIQAVTSIKKGPLRDLYLKKIYPDQYFPLESGMKKLQQGNFAFHVLLQAAYVYILKNFTNYEICGLQELPGYIEENRGYVAVPKHSPYKDLLKVAILKVDEYGLQRRTNLRVIMKPKCFSQSATFKSVGFYDCEQVLWIWVFGTILALVLFVGEESTLPDSFLKMKILQAFILFLAFEKICSTETDLQFLEDFFKNRNVALSIHNCWTKSKNNQLLRKMATVGQVGLYHPSDINDLKKWPSSAYLVLDLRECESSYEILAQINKANIFVYPLNYLLLVDEAAFSPLSETLSRYEILPNCELVIAVFTATCVFLHQTYKVGKINELTWERYGNWSLANGLYENYRNVPKHQRRVDLKGANLAVGLVIFENDTLNHLTDYMYPGIDTFTKQDFEPMMCVLRHMNVNYSFLVVDNYGYVDEKTGLFSGLVREVQTGRADVSAGSIFFTKERYEAVDLIKQGNPHPIRFVVKKPSTSYIKNIFLITLNSNVWVASTVILAVFALVVYVILNWEAKNKEKVKQNKYSVSDVTLIALEAVCQQGTTTEPQSFAGRILSLILFGAFMFIYVSYSANIVVLLQSTTKINDIQELVDSRIEAAGCQIHYMKNYFEGVRKGPLRHLYLSKIYPDQYYPLEVGMKKVQQGNFAFHVSLQSAYEYILHYFTNYEICGLQELPGYIEENLGYIAVPKLSPYKDLFKVVILKVDEYGLQRRTNQRILMKPKCFSHSATFKSVGFYDCEQVLWIWVFGTLFSLVVFFAEKLIHHFAHKFHARQTKRTDDM
ncbi:uncharacterized protein LOC103313532 [Tribolium castaneum]|uniref:uncharacterized protein LOC103313532 n=1 Tax=Tribolium castaneum TaxID=7070 RepID=UPI0030FF1E7A